MPGATAEASHKGSFTLRSSGALLVVSAAFEILSITDEVALFGSVRGGGIAVAYHALYAVAFSLMGVGLWRGAPWGYRAVLVGIGISVVDKVRYLLDEAARSAETARQPIFELVDHQSIDAMVSATVLFIVVSWIGFAFYVYRHRDYFRSSNPEISKSSKPPED